MMDSLSPRLYEILIAVTLGALCYFLKRLIESVDRISEKVEAINITLAKQYYTKDEIEERLSSVHESLGNRIQLCELKHHRVA